LTVDVALPLVKPPWHDAVACARSAAHVLPVEQVTLSSAIGRVLASEVRAFTPLPSFSSSAMDGWAVAGPGPWRVVGTANAGRPHGRPLGAGTAVRVATGAAVPSGATAVVRLEQGHETDGELWSDSRPPLCADIRPQGEELHSGAVLAPGGAIVTPPLAGLAAAAGHDELPVRRRPRVSVRVLGDELLAEGPARAGRIRDALGVQIPGWVDWLGGEVVSLRFVADRRDATEVAISDADGDVVVTVGGSSVGNWDHVRSAIGRVGGTLAIDGVAVKPGHPMLLASLPAERWLVGLPGNPGAAVAAILTLLRPLLAGLLGRRETAAPSVIVATDLSGARVHRLEPAIEADGMASLARGRGPAMLTGWAAASCALVVPPEGARAGSLVESLPLPYT
jgi:molybdopterin molybdotransferase